MKFYMWRIRLNSQGYDNMGAYWGIGQPLYYYSHEWPNEHGHYIQETIRASSREDAKAKIRVKYPKARFYR